MIFFFQIERRRLESYQEDSMTDEMIPKLQELPKKSRVERMGTESENGGIGWNVRENG